MGGCRGRDGLGMYRVPEIHGFLFMVFISNFSLFRTFQCPIQVQLPHGVTKPGYGSCHGPAVKDPSWTSRLVMESHAEEGSVPQSEIYMV